MPWRTAAELPVVPVGPLAPVGPWPPGPWPEPPHAQATPTPLNAIAPVASAVVIVRDFSCILVSSLSGDELTGPGSPAPVSPASDECKSLPPSLRKLQGSRSTLVHMSEENGQQRTRVLVVDDEPNILDVISMALRYERFEVETAANGREALSARCARSGRT